MPNPHCDVAGCDRPCYARQPYCEPHYRRLRRTGDLDPDRAIGATVEAKPCMVDSCGNTSTERGLCHGHYLRLIRSGDVRSARPLGRRVNVDCEVAACGRPAYARQLCKTHYRRLLDQGDVHASTPIRQLGGGTLSHGYRIVAVTPDLQQLTGGRKREAEHRVVMAMMLGRALRDDESVHHRNGNRLDNRPDNLELWSRWQPSGQRLSDRLKHALELLDRYLPDCWREVATRRRHGDTA